MRVESTSTNAIQISNIHPRLSFYIGADARPLLPGEVFQATEEIVVSLPENRTVRISICAPDSLEGPISQQQDEPFRTIQGSIDSTMEFAAPVRLNQIIGGTRSEDNGRVAVDLVRSALSVVRQAAGSNEFFDAAVRSIAQMVDLDRALALVREGNEWVVKARHSSDPETTGEKSSKVSSFSQGLLGRVLKTGKTVVYDPKNFLHTTDSSMMALDRAVAAPVLDENNRVIGALLWRPKIRVV